MTALAFDFDFGPADGVAVAPEPRRRLYAVRGSVDARPAAAPTLDALLGTAWAALGASAPAACPVCDATMRPRRTAGSGFGGGRCDDCGTSLA